MSSSWYTPTKLFLILVLAVAFLPTLVAAQQDARSVLVNYAEVGKQSTSNQAVNVYFTLLDDNDQAVGAPTINQISLALGEAAYTGTISVPETPLYITLVLDTSGSMQSVADQLREAAVQAIIAAPPGTYFSAYHFNDTVTRTNQYTYTADLRSLIDDILSNSYRDYTGRCFYDALFQAIEQAQKSAPAGRRAVIIFTDSRNEIIDGGELDRCSTHDIVDVIASARDGSARVPIFTIGLQRSSVVNFSELERIAIVTGGAAKIGNLDQLSEIFQQVVQTLASQQQATFNVCLPANIYSGIMTINGSLSSEVRGINLTTECTTLLEKVVITIQTNLIETITIGIALLVGLPLLIFFALRRRRDNKGYDEPEKIAIFISYRRDPSAMLANLIATKLEQNGIQVFVDTRSIDGGGPFPKRLIDAIYNSDVFVCLVADTTFDSDWVRKEIEYAHTAGKTMIPMFQQSWKRLTPKPEPPTTHIEALLDSDGVHVLDQDNEYVDDAIERLAKMIRATVRKPKS